MKKTDRRQFLTAGAVGGTLGIMSSSIQAAGPTPKETEGPFYPVVMQKDKDFDLTQIEGNTSKAKGAVIVIQGKILDTDGRPVEDATVDLWQANAAGRYHHPHDQNPAPLDPNFQGWAIVPSGKEGGFRFQTIMPGAYPVTRTWKRPPHIHFKISKRGFVELTTQMYFPGHELNEPDRLLNRKTEKEQSLMVSKKISDKPETYQFDIYIQKA